jgi:hypothetical protein
MGQAVSAVQHKAVQEHGIQQPLPLVPGVIDLLLDMAEAKDQMFRARVQANLGKSDLMVHTNT